MNNYIHQSKYAPYIFLFTGGLILALSACDLFESNDYKLPIIEITGFFQDKDTTLVQVSADDSGTELEYIGISYNQTGNPHVTENQILFGPGSGELLLPVEELTPESLYYFRAFIVEENVFAESEVDSFRVPLPEPPIPPCTLEEGVIMDGINVYDDLSSGTSDTYEGYVLIVYPANLTGGSFRFTFIDYPTSDVYTPSYELDYEFPNWVRVEYWGTGAPIKNFEREGAVYIEKLEDFKWSVSFCGLKYQLGSASPREVSGNFQVED